MACGVAHVKLGEARRSVSSWLAVARPSESISGETRPPCSRQTHSLSAIATPLAEWEVTQAEPNRLLELTGKAPGGGRPIREEYLIVEGRAGGGRGSLVFRGRRDARLGGGGTLQGALTIQTGGGQLTKSTTALGTT